MKIDNEVYEYHEKNIYKYKNSPPLVIVKNTRNYEMKVSTQNVL